MYDMRTYEIVDLRNYECIHTCTQIQMYSPLDTFKTYIVYENQYMEKIIFSRNTPRG